MIVNFKIISSLHAVIININYFRLKKHQTEYKIFEHLKHFYFIYNGPKKKHLFETQMFQTLYL